MTERAKYLRGQAAALARDAEEMRNQAEEMERCAWDDLDRAADLQRQADEIERRAVNLERESDEAAHDSPAEDAAWAERRAAWLDQRQIGLSFMATA